MKILLSIVLLTTAALLVHGYHLGIEDQAIYLPGIGKNLHPGLFPKDAELFLPQTRPTFLIEAVSLSVRATRLPLEAAIFIWQILSLFLLLFAAWRLACRCFVAGEARWGAVVLLAALFSMPVAGTSLYVADAYLHPRTLATALILFAVVDVLDRRVRFAAIWIALAAIIHIQMAFYGFLLCCFLGWRPFQSNQTSSAQPAGLLFAFPLQSLFQPGSDAWKEAARIHTQHYLRQWEWYEWLGAIAPPALLLWMSGLARKSGLELAAFVCRRAATFQVFSIAAALVLTLPPQFERLTPYQPMRALHVTTLIFVLLAGGFIGQFLLRRRVVLWLALFVPLCACMFYVQTREFSGSDHLELPGMSVKNPWVRAFEWVKNNTPEDAYFALDPLYMERPGEDQHGFRGLSRRGMMADALKDAGVVTLFPAIASRWREETRARVNWNSFTVDDFLRLRERYGVSWVVLEKPLHVVMSCPYENEKVAVCRIENR